MPNGMLLTYALGLAFHGAEQVCQAESATCPNHAECIDFFDESYATVPDFEQ
jgi:hypothetical protein